MCIWFGLLTLLLNLLAHRFPDDTEKWYSRGLFQGVRLGFDWTVGQLPVPAFYLFWAGVLAFWVVLYRRRPSLQGFRSKSRYWLVRLAGFAGLLAGLFFWLWGFNYARVPLETQMDLPVLLPDTVSLWSDLMEETRILDSLRTRLAGTDTMALDDRRFRPAGAEDTVRAAVEKWLAAEGFPTGGRVRGRFLYPQGTLFLFGASGLYWPFSGEGNVEAGLHPLRVLPTMAHEMSHGYGFCDEGVCNFIAYAACSEHPDPYIAYSARLSYWSTLARACRSHDRERFREYLRQAPAGILSDERAIRRQHDKFGELAPTLRPLVYDTYLKSNGIESGMRNYDKVLVLVRAWRATRRH